jgi:3-oxoacyl-[acyl-carrier-protein] synthase II
MKQRVWVTGLGALCSLGDGVDGILEALQQGKSGLVYEDIHGYSTAIGRVRSDLKTGLLFGMDATRDRATLMALHVARQAIGAAALCDPVSSKSHTDFHDRWGVFWGVGSAGMQWIEQTYATYFEQHGLARLSPWTIPAIMPNAAAASIAMAYGIRGVCTTFTSACASSALAIGEAMLALEQGRLDVAIVGGCDAMLVPGILHAWARMRVLAKTSPELAFEACKPFDAARRGLCLGEGAACLVLETKAHALARGASPLAAIAGFGQSCDASDMTEPTVAGQVLAMQRALAHAEIDPADLGYVNAHATGTRNGDGVELAALRSALGDAMHVCPVSSIKSSIGHTIGAAGAVEAVMSIAALQKNWLPPTAFLQEVDAAFADARLIRGAGEAADGVNYMMSNSFGFGGTNAAVVIART